MTADPLPPVPALPPELARPLPLRRRLFGPRTFGILLCSWIWVLMGIGAFVEIPPDTRPGVLHLLIPGWIRGLVWLGVAAFAAATAWSRKWSTVALGLLWIPPAVNLASYLMAWVVSSEWVPGHGYPDGWYAAGFFLALVGIVILAAMSPARPAHLPSLPAPKEHL